MKKKISFLSLLVASFLIVMPLASCKDQNQGGGATPEFNVRKLSLWGKNILSKKDGDKVELSGSDNPKILQVTETMVKDYTVSVIVDDEEPITKATKTGIVKLDLKKLPETEKGMLIKLSANGVKEWSKAISVQMLRGVAGDLQIAFAKGEDNVERFIPKGEKPTFSTSKGKGKITLKTSSSEMSKVIIDGNDVTKTALATDKKSATYELPITATNNQEQPVNVEVEFEYFLKATAEFKVAKYASPSDFPLRVLKASIGSGNNYSKNTKLEFNEQNKATVRLNDIRFSHVKLDMEFDNTLLKRDVIKCTDQRPANYSTEFKEGESDNGIFSGYVVAQVKPSSKGLVKEQLKQISDSKYKYAELLIVGCGTVSYDIKFTSENNKEATYTVEIVNELSKPIEKDPFFNSFFMSNGNSGRPVFYSPGRALNLPFYSKGSTATVNSEKMPVLNSAGLTDVSYMDNVSIIGVSPTPRDQSGNYLEPYIFLAFYNVFDDEAGSPKDKHEFTMVIPTGRQNKDGKVTLVLTPIVNLDLNNKYFDFFIANEKNTPYPMISLYYGKKWRRMSPKHGLLISLFNNQKVTWPDIFGTQQLDSGLGFASVYNYRLQSIVADNLNKSSGTGELTIYKNLSSFKHWEFGVDFPTLRDKYMVGKTASDKDIFTLSPIFENAKDVIKTLKYTIKKKKAGSEEYDNDATFNSYEAKAAEEGGYIIGAKKENPGEAIYAFEDGNVYRVEVEVEYNSEAQKDKFHYLLDYKSTDKTIDIMDIADDMDMGHNLFGLPTSYGVKTIDPAILQDIATTRYTSLQDMSSYVK